MPFGEYGFEHQRGDSAARLRAEIVEAAGTERADERTPNEFARVGGGGGSCSTKIAEFSNDLSESKRPTSTIGQKALVQVQNRYSRSVLASNHPASATGST